MDTFQNTQNDGGWKFGTLGRHFLEVIGDLDD